MLSGRVNLAGCWSAGRMAGLGPGVHHGPNQPRRCGRRGRSTQRTVTSLFGKCLGKSTTDSLSAGTPVRTLKTLVYGLVTERLPPVGHEASTPA